MPTAPSLLHPIALCEVQGYAYAAYQEMSYLAERLGKCPRRPRSWERKAERLRWNFLRALLVGRRACLLPGSGWAEAPMSGRQLQCRAMSVDQYRAAGMGGVMVSRLMADDMYTGWGIRTLSASRCPLQSHELPQWIGLASRYRPDRRGLRPSWAHRRGGASARQSLRCQPPLFRLTSAGAFLRLRSGLGGYGPTRYPVACSPQSWAAGAPFLLLSSALGFQPEAEHQKLTLSAPALP